MFTNTPCINAGLAGHILSNKVIVITGGCGLLGRQFSNTVAQENGIAVVADINKSLAQSIVEKLVSEGYQAEAAFVDITNRASIDAVIADLDVRYGRIDAVINNAYPRNQNYGRKLEDVSYEDFCENVSSHLGGYFLVAQCFAKYFSKHGGGSIINMASIYGVMSPRFEIYADTHMTLPVEYAAVKSAIIQLTRYFAQYYKKDGVRVNAIAPGGILDHQPEAFINHYKSHCGQKGMLNPQDIAGALLFLLSDAAKYVNGQNLIIDDGFSL